MATTTINLQLETGQKVTLFPASIPVVQLIPQFIRRAKEIGVSQALEEFEKLICDIVIQEG